MQILPYLHFDGRCREAFEFYRTVLDGDRLDMMTWGDGPMAAELPKASHQRVMHACLQSSGAILMGADSPHGQTAAADGARDCINVMVETAGEAERIWARLSDGAQVQMPLEPTFWAERFGMLVDRYGKAWMVNCLARDPATCGEAT